MATTRVRTSKAPGRKANTPPEITEWQPPPVRLSAIGEYFRRIAEQYTPGAVQVDPHRQSGAPVLDDTRIPIRYVLGQLADGRSWSEITAEYPAVTEERIRAALEFAYAALGQPQIEIQE